MRLLTPLPLNKGEIINDNMEFIKMLLNRLPMYHYNVWYNQSIWIKEDKYPVVFDENKEYISCRIGLKVIMGKTKTGENIYYKVTQYSIGRGGDYFYSSDGIRCTLRFSHIEKLINPKD